MRTATQNAVAASGESRLSKGGLWWEVAKGITVGAAAVFSALANLKGQQNAQALEAIKQNASERAQQAQLDLKVYELLEKTLSAEEKKGHGLAVAAIINALTKPPLRDELLNALGAGAQDETLQQRLQDMKQFDSQSEQLYKEQPKLKTGSTESLHTGRRIMSFDWVSPAHAQGQQGSLKGYRVDLFYCESALPTTTVARRQRAEAASTQLRQRGESADVRVRLLPLLIQARPGYQSALDEIRFSGEGGEPAAARRLGQVLGIAAGNVRQIDFLTPNYISVFFCA